MTQTAQPIVHEGAKAKSLRSNLRRSITGKELQSIALVPVIIAVAIIGNFISPYFLTSSNIIGNVVAVSAALGILVIAESIILISGFFDLSLESTVGFSVMVLCVALGAGLPLWLGTLVAVGIAVAIGLFNGLMVAVLRLNAFIVTLAMLILIQGFTLGFSNGVTYTNIPDFILFFGTASVFGIPIQAVLFVLMFTVSALFMRFTRTGRSIYAMGGNIEAARAAGLKIRRLTMGLFVFGALMAVLAGWMLAAKTAAATPNLGAGLIFTVFAAAVLGGIDLNGGRGSLIGAALGVVLLSMIQNILTLSNVPSFWINAAYGAIILSALIVGRVSALASRMRRRKK
ncbi:ABC transporter permease [Pseudarthrobacter oxydans]|uniref:ABC transporter permease n=1 Tax=Pseudarthrobacter oxydans TaxID=1671 RepID=UPI003D2C56F8